jgi:hypothetical protein
MISVDTLTAAAAPGVRNPAMSHMPLRMARSPRAHDVAAGSGGVCQVNSTVAGRRASGDGVQQQQTDSRPAAGESRKEPLQPSLLGEWRSTANALPAR